MSNLTGTLGAALAAALLTLTIPAGAGAVEIKKPVIKEEGQTPKEAPTGSDCRKQAQAAADKVKRAGGTEKEQQAAYGTTKMQCENRM